MSLLTLVQEAAGSLNQPVPTAIFGSTTGDAVLWRNLAQREGRELAKRHDWQAITKGKVQTTLATPAQTAFPSDFDHMLVNSRVWNATLAQPYVAVDFGTWLAVNELNQTIVPGVYMIEINTLFIFPTPTAGQSIAYYYVSKNFCQSSGATEQDAWAADSDTGIVPESLISLGIIWRWLRAKGMDYAEEMQTYEREVERASSRDRAQKTVLIVGGPNPELPPSLRAGFITV